MNIFQSFQGIMRKKNIIALFTTLLSWQFVDFVLPFSITKFYIEISLILGSLYSDEISSLWAVTIHHVRLIAHLNLLGTKGFECAKPLQWIVDKVIQTDGFVLVIFHIFKRFCRNRVVEHIWLEEVGKDHTLWLSFLRPIEDRLPDKLNTRCSTNDWSLSLYYANSYPLNSG